MVFLAFALDLGEWTSVIFNPMAVEDSWADSRLFLTIAGCALFGGALGFFLGPGRVSGALAGAAVAVSHVVLDAQEVRRWIAHVGGATGVTNEHGEYLLQVILAECRIYGLLMMLGILYAAARRDVRKRSACTVLAVIVTASAATSRLWIWGTVYTATSAYALWPMRRRITLAAAWNLIPLTLVAALAMAHAEAAIRLNNATALLKSGESEAAIRGFEYALRMPARSGRMAAYGRMGEAYEQLKRYRDAEACYRRAVAVAKSAGWYDLLLGNLYARQGIWSASRADEAQAVYRRLRDDPRAAPQLREQATKELAKIS
jgi:tetratricopeptide (TPR) repeat protein